MENQKCPYCGEKMVPGTLCAQAADGLVFRASQPPRFLKRYELCKVFLFRHDINFPASICLPCGKLILELPPDEESPVELL